MLTMPQNSHQDRLRQAGRERSRADISGRLAEQRWRGQSEALRRANVLESGTDEERAALRAEYVRQAQRGPRLKLEWEAEHGNFLARLELATGAKWTSGEAPDDVVWSRPIDGRC